jgi:hypothetical protein
MNNKTKIIPPLTSLLIICTILTTGCGTSSDSSDHAVTTVSQESSESSANKGIASSSYQTDASYDTATIEEDTNQTNDTDSMTLLEEKLVYHCDMDIETLDYDTTISSIKAAIKKYNGIIQSEKESDSSYNWYYENYQKTSGTMTDYIEARIPSSGYDDFISEMDGVGKITSKSTSVDNISQEYYDTTSQIEALQIQEQNLLEMLEKCETIEDMITVEERLSEVRYQLNNLQTSRRYMDTDVAYSYVNINVSEVMEYHYNEAPVKKNTFTDRLKNTLKSTGSGFLSFLEGLLFLIIRLFPYLVIIAVICLIFRKKIKTAMEEHKNKKAADKARKQLKDNAVIQQAQFQQQQMQQPNIAPNTNNSNLYNNNINNTNQKSNKGE